MMYVYGKLFYKEKFIKGYIGFEEGKIKEIGKGSMSNAIVKGLIIPAFFNAHTHVGDSIAKDIEIKNSLEKVMKPPNGIKHKILKKSKAKDIIKSMRETIKDMLESGTTFFADFRELGLKGISQLENAIKHLPISAFVFARPINSEYSKDEIDKILERADGVGLSGISDWDFEEAKKISKHVKNKGKKFAIHASEDFREDIDKILDLNPDFLVHMTMAKDSDLEIVADNEIPIVVCPRANVFFGKIPNIPKMLKIGIKLNLGTDNCMINTADIFREMEFAYKISRLRGKVLAKEIFKMAISPKILNLRNEVEVGNIANFLVLKINSENPYKAVVNYASPRNIALIAVGKYIWRRENG